MHARFILLTTAAMLTACATAQENPNYEYSTTYKGDTPYVTQTAGTTVTTTTRPVTYVQTTPSASPTIIRETQAVASPSYATQNASYQTVTASTASAQNASYTQLDHRCLSAETNRQLIGGAVGGTVGAVVGKKLIGGTKGTLAGAALGGAAGYGIGDKSINCDPITVAIPQQSATISPAYYGGAQTTGQAQMIYANAQSATPQAPTDAAMPESITQSYGTPGYQAMMGQSPEIVGTTPQTAPYQYQPAAVTTQAVSGPVMTSTSTMALPYGASSHQVIEGDTVYSLSRKRCASIEAVKQMNGLSADFAIKIGDTIALPASQC